MTKKKTEALHTIIAFVADETSEEVIKSIPFEEYDLKLLLFRGTAKTAYEYLKNNRSPNVLLVDVTGSELPISDVAALADVCEPGVEVVTIGDSNDISIFRGLLNLGVRDYIVKPLTTNLLVRGIENIVSNEKKLSKTHGFSKLGNVISFIGAHGGVGTSTIAANCAWLLSEKFYKLIYLLDLHLQTGMLCHFFDLPTTPNLKEFIDHPDRLDKNLIDKSFAKYSERLIVASAQDTLNEWNNINPEGLKKLISFLCNQSHYTILDVPTNFENPITSLILSNSNYVVIVADLTFFSVRDTSRILKLLKEVRQMDQKIIVMANRVGEYKQGEVERKIFEDSIQAPVDFIVHFDHVNPLNAINSGKPIASLDNTFTHEIQALSDIFLGKEAHQEKGFISKIFRSLHVSKSNG